jgi:hypothetical protein
MALLGSTIDPRLFSQDFSGYADAARTSANGMTNAINSVGNTITDYAKEQKDGKAKLKASQAQIDAAITLFPDQAEHLSKVAAEIRNEETPLSERVAVASGIADMINMGVGQKRYEAEQDWKRKDYEMARTDQGIRQSESASRSHIQGLQSQAAEIDLQKVQQDDETRRITGPGFYDTVLGELGKSNKGLADSIKASSEGLSDVQKYEVAQKASAWLPKVAEGAVPPRMEVSVPGGTRTMERGPDGVWQPIRVGGDLTEKQIYNGDFLPPPDMPLDANGQSQGGSQEGGVLPPIGAIATPPGFTPTPVDPRLQIAANQEARAQEADKRDKAKFQAEGQQAEAAKQIAISKSETFMGALDELEKHKGFNELFGVGFGTRKIAATDGFNANVLFDRVKGASFLEAVAALKGMGSLSNAEGDKMTQGFLGMNEYMSEDAARSRIGQLKNQMKQAIDRVKATKVATPGAAPQESDEDIKFRQAGQSILDAFNAKPKY